jgi:hypothetical protein
MEVVSAMTIAGIVFTARTWSAAGVRVLAPASAAGVASADADQRAGAAPDPLVPQPTWHPRLPP